MENLTKKQVKTRWIVGFILGLLYVIPIVCFTEVPFSVLVIWSVLLPIVFAWVVFATTLCWKDMLKYGFTFHWIKMFGVYFASLGKAIVITVKVLASKDGE